MNICINQAARSSFLFEWAFRCCCSALHVGILEAQSVEYCGITAISQRKILERYFQFKTFSKAPGLVKGYHLVGGRF